jgi:hypothetical protein
MSPSRCAWKLETHLPSRQRGHKPGHSSPVRQTPIETGGESRGAYFPCASRFRWKKAGVFRSNPSEAGGESRGAYFP